MTHDNVLWTLFGVAILAFLMPGGGALASEKIAERESMVCTSCHDKPGSRLLTDKGKFFELMGSLEGFDQVEASFEKCTYCHVRKPGSHSLTRKGTMFNSVVGDMEGLLEWLRREHPIRPTGTIEDTGEETAEGRPRGEDRE